MTFTDLELKQISLLVEKQIFDVEFEKLDMKVICELGEKFKVIIKEVSK